MAARVLVVTALAACSYEVNFEDCVVRCQDNAGCPDGLACEAEGFCRIPDPNQTCAEVLDTRPSCADLPKTCGPARDEDCCSAGAPISGGSFFRSYDVAADGMYSNTSYPATVSPFQLDRFEVTVGRFRKFVEGAGTQTSPPLASSGARRLNGVDGQGGWKVDWTANLAADIDALVAALKCDTAYQSWTDVTGANEELPVNCVTWFEAMAFCVWDGGFLPTEAEWNYAAAGGAEQRAYPWSSPADTTNIDCTLANYRVDSPPGTSCTNGTVGAVQTVGRESPIGDGKWRQADLAGNIWEWTVDQYGPYETSCDDCANLTAGASRSMRGGHFGDTALFLRGSFRNYVEQINPIHPDSRRYSVGMRCARSAAQQN